MDQYIGKKFDGRYEIEELIGVGGMANVYKGYDILEDETVAIKILREEYATSEDFLRRFKNESKAISLLNHPNIVKVFDVSITEAVQYIVMEHIDGITLKEYITQKGVLPWKDAVHFITQILKAMQHAHDMGVVHRDIKPQNIMLLQDGSIKVMDFGIARLARSQTRTMTDKAIGSVHYISPEQAKGDVTDAKTDIYSAGVILFEMLTGQLPFQAETAVSVAIKQIADEPVKPRDINPEIPEGLEEITLKAMQKDVEKRYQTASSMLVDIEEFKKNPSISFEYKYFVDDAPTKYVDAIKEVQAKESDKVKLNTTKEGVKAKKKKPSSTAVLMGIAAACIVVMVGALIFMFAGGGKEDPVEIPSFLGMTEQEVESSEYKEKLTITYEDGTSNEYESGQIMKQNINAGRNVEKGQPIILTVCRGENKVTLSDYKGMLEQSAIDDLERKGLKVSVKTEFNKEVEEGRVTRTDPGEGKEVPEGSTVNLYISKGEEDTSVEVPDLRGEAKGDVSSILVSAGLKLGKTSEDFSDSVAEGKVISQSVTPGSSAEKGSAVDIVISKGPENTTIPVPPVEGMTRDDATTTLKNAGFRVIYEERESTAAEKGKVISQSPGSGSEKQKGDEVTITIGKGPAA